jgi:hypothetical protein
VKALAATMLAFAASAGAAATSMDDFGRAYRQSSGVGSNAKNPGQKAKSRARAKAAYKSKRAQRKGRK